MASHYDLRMEQIRAERAQRRQAGEGYSDEIWRIQESTETINSGMADPLNWALWIGGIVLIPFTGGLSIGLIVWGLLRMTAYGKAYAQAIVPVKEDLVYPRLGCQRILAAIGTLFLTLVTIGIWGICIMFML